MQQFGQLVKSTQHWPRKDSQHMAASWPAPTYIFTQHSAHTRVFLWLGSVVMTWTASTRLIYVQPG